MRDFPANLERLGDSDKLKLRTCMKRPISIKATQINERFRVNAPNGTVMQGSPGDYLMCGVENELYHCPESVFDKSYDWVEKIHDGST